MKNCDMKIPRQAHTVRSVPHLACQLLLPTGRKHLQLEWTASYDLHRRKVMSAKPAVDMTPPKTYSHLKLKKCDEELKRKLERENKKLMEKISHIMRTPGETDKRNYYEKKSLGKEKRQQELLRITKENQMIKRRLSQCEPFYTVRRWHEDWLETLKVMDRIAHYPRQQATQQKGQETPMKKCSDIATEQKSSADATTYSSASNVASGKAESKNCGKNKETSKKKGTETEIQEDMVTLPAAPPNWSEKSISSGTPEDPVFSDIAQITAETFSSPGRSEI